MMSSAKVYLLIKLFLPNKAVMQRVWAFASFIFLLLTGLYRFTHHCCVARLYGWEFYSSKGHREPQRCWEPQRIYISLYYSFSLWLSVAKNLNIPLCTDEIHQWLCAAVAVANYSPRFNLRLNLCCNKSPINYPTVQECDATKFNNYSGAVPKKN